MYGTLDDKISIPPPIDPAGGGGGGGQDQQQTPNGHGDTAAAAARRRRKIYSHCHVQSEESPGAGAHLGVDKSARRRLIAASVICLIFMIGEVVGGILSNSLAIATDAAHLLTDFASFMISLFAIWLSSRPATRKMSFGWYRAEVIGALLSVLMIWLVTGLLVYLAIERLRTQEFEINSLVMVITASAGLLVNIIMAVALHADGHGHGHSHSHSHGHGGHFHSHGHDHDHSHDIHGHNHLEHLDEDDDGEFHDHETQVVIGNGGGQLQQSHAHVSIDCSMKARLTGKNSGATGERDATSDEDAQERLAQKEADDREEEKKRKIKIRKAKCSGAESPAGAGAGRGKSNINVRAAFVHVLGDFLQSLGVLIAALVIHFEPSYAIVDPICTFLFSFIVLVTTINIIRDAVNVLMEGIPDGINFIEVREKLHSEPYVIRVHNLRIWSLSLDKIAISTHLVIDAERVTSAQALRRAISLLKSSYNFFEVTIQIEEYQKDMKDCEQCQDDDSVNVTNAIANGSGGHSPNSGAPANT